MFSGANVTSKRDLLTISKNKFEGLITMKINIVIQ